MTIRFLHFAFLLTYIFLSSSTYANGGNTLSINFTGSIDSGSCDTSSGSTSTVMLGDISKSVFKSKGSLSVPKPFEISINCPDDGGPDKATVTFTGVSSSDPTLLAIDNSGQSDAAYGVAIRISSNSQKVDLNSPSGIYGLTPGMNRLMFIARYESLVAHSDIISGTANATAQFTINYP